MYQFLSTYISLQRIETLSMSFAEYCATFSLSFPMQCHGKTDQMIILDSLEYYGIPRPVRCLVLFMNLVNYVFVFPICCNEWMVGDVSLKLRNRSFRVDREWRPRCGRLWPAWFRTFATIEETSAMVWSFFRECRLCWRLCRSILTLSLAW